MITFDKLKKNTAMNVKPSLLLFFLFMTQRCFAQGNTNAEANNANCENTAIVCLQKLAASDINQTDSVLHLLQFWKTSCGEIEPILRLEILLAIQKGIFKDSNHQVYIDNFINKYIDRAIASNEMRYDMVYENQKSYYDYVPLKSEFDNFTKQFASDLITKQKANSSAYYLCLLFTDNVKGFTDEINADSLGNSTVKKSVLANEENTNAYDISFDLNSGVWFPLGTLANTFNPSPQIGFKINIPMFKTFLFGFGLNIRFLENKNPFNITKDSIPTQTKGTIGLSFGIFVSKEYNISKKILFDVLGGVGIGRIHTTLKMPPNAKNEDNYYSVQTVDFTMGFNLKKKIFKKSTIGLQTCYNITPYQYDSNLPNSIGSKSMNVSLLYSF
jgi:hypothetical protein